MEHESERRTVSPEELKNWLDRRNNFLLIDALPKKHYETVRIPGAQSACVYEVTFPLQIEALTTNRKKTIVVYDSSAHSMASTIAAGKLAGMGFEDVYELEGGVAAWNAAGYPLEGDASGVDAPPDEGFRLRPGAYEVDVEQSVIEWTGRNANTRHYGALRFNGGSLRLEDESLRGWFGIDPDSIVNFNIQEEELRSILIAHLKSEDFFFVDRFPKVRFEITEARPAGETKPGQPNYTVTGALNMRGASADISFPATVAHLPEGQLAAEAHFDIDRTRWGVIYGSGRYFEHLGMHLVYDLISVQIRIVAMGT